MSRGLFDKGNLIRIMHLMDDYIYYDEIDDLSKNTIDYDNIFYIDCSNNKIDNIKGIHLFKNLQELRCDGNKVKDFSELNSLEYINYLSIRESNLRKIPDLPSKILELDVSRNKIKHLNVGNITNLKILNATSNMLKSISDYNFIGDDNTPINIEELYLSFNQISEINLSINTLTKLCIDNNLINSLSSSMFQSLKYFDCSMNKIPFLEDILKTVNLDILDKFYSYGNLYENYQTLHNINLNNDLAIVYSNCFNKPIEKKTIIDTYEDTDYEYKKVFNNRNSKFKDFYDEYY